MPEDAAACYNCALDLAKAEVEEKRETRKWTLGTVLMFAGVVGLVAIAILQGVRYQRWSAYHDQVKRINSFDSSVVGATGLPVPPNDPVQGSLKGWPINSDPYPRLDPADNTVIIKN